VAQQGEVRQSDAELQPADASALEAQLRSARRPGILTVPDAIRRGRVSVSSTAVVAVLALVVALGCAFLLRVLWAERASTPQPVGAAGSPRVQVTPGSTAGAGGGFGSTPSEASTSGSSLVVVHVVGAVAKPGLVRLQQGARVADAIAAAGGLTAKADPSQLNLARLVADGEQVHVPRQGEVVVGAPGGLSGGALGGAAGAGAGAGGLVNLNSADLTALDSLPGVGPVLAQRIVDWRTEHGRFTSVDELGEVSGIGDKLMSQLRPKVTV
jgi:competence protein ComEA